MKFLRLTRSLDIQELLEVGSPFEPKWCLTFHLALYTHPTQSSASIYCQKNGEQEPDQLPSKMEANSEIDHRDERR